MSTSHSKEPCTHCHGTGEDALGGMCFPCNGSGQSLGIDHASHSKETLSALEVDLIEEDQTHTETMYLYWHDVLSKWILHGTDTLTGHGYTLVQKVEVTVPVPANFDLRAAKLASLREEEQRARANLAAILAKSAEVAA